MILKRVFILVMLFVNQLLISQAFSVEGKIQKIDSLIFSENQLKEAEIATNELYDFFIINNTKNEYERTFQDALLYKSYLEFTLNRRPDQALKTALQVIDRNKQYSFPEKEYRACLIIAIMYESTNEFELCKIYLDKANELCRNNQLENIYSIYCIRMASYYRLLKQQDSAVYFAYKGLDYAQKYENERELTDVYLLLGMLLNKSNYEEAVQFSMLSLKGFKKRKDYKSAVYQYSNISKTFFDNKRIYKALAFNDSALINSKKYLSSGLEGAVIMKTRAQIFDSLGYVDSAYFYFKQYHHGKLEELSKMEKAEVNRITAQYENDKKAAIIHNKNVLLFFVGTIGLLIAIGFIVMTRKNKKITAQNKVIKTQLLDLAKSLSQKQVLLSELQHRVKNNLQHVISILEIQKESINFNTIEEVIRGNQNRIHSMALLHEKLNIFESITDIYLDKYITELSVLVKDSYKIHDKEIELNVICEIEKITIERVLPVGFIVVELISNSMKHAFNTNKDGAINISIKNNEASDGIMLKYNDNGAGFDFNIDNDEGLGLEIIKGLIEQLEGTVETNKTNGFELIIFFK